MVPLRNSASGFLFLLAGPRRGRWTDTAPTWVRLSPHSDAGRLVGRVAWKAVEGQVLQAQNPGSASAGPGGPQMGGPGPHIDTEEASEVRGEFAFVCLRLSPSSRL